MDDAPICRAYLLARRSAEVQSAAAVASGGILSADRPDMEQTALIRVWHALPAYNPALGALSTYVEWVVRSEGISFLRSECRRRRIATEPLTEIPVDPISSLELRIDIRIGLSLLPDQERQVAAGLMVHRPAEVARQLGVARSTVYQRMRAIRRCFESIGLSAAR